MDAVAGGAVEVDDKKWPLTFALLTVGKDLARPLPEPPIDQFDLAHRQAARVGKRQQQRMAVGRITGNAHGIGHEFVGNGCSRALEQLGQPVVSVELLPQRRRRHAAGEPVNQHQLLADVEPPLQQLGFDALQLGIAFEQRLEARGVLLPQRLPERDGLVGGKPFALDGRLGLAGIAPCELGVQMQDLCSGQLGDRAALARRQGCGGHGLQLAKERVVGLRDAEQGESLHPLRCSVDVRKSEPRHLVRHGERRRRGDLHQGSLAGHEGGRDVGTANQRLRAIIYSTLS